MCELGEVKDALDMEVKQNFIDPLQVLHDKDLKEIQVLVPYIVDHTPDFYRTGLLLLGLLFLHHASVLYRIIIATIMFVHQTSALYQYIIGWIIIYLIIMKLFLLLYLQSI